MIYNTHNLVGEVWFPSQNPTSYSKFFPEDPSSLGTTTLAIVFQKLSSTVTALSSVSKSRFSKTPHRSKSAPKKTPPKSVSPTPSSSRKQHSITDSKQKVCIIPGGTGALGKEFAQEAIQRGYKTIITTRSTSGYQNSENVEYVQASLEDQSNPEFWKELISQYEEAESVTVINALGAPTAPAGKTLREVNVIPTKAMAQALKELEDNGKLNDSRFVHLSSMGSIMLKEDEYGITKKESEEIVQELGPKSQCILRVGYAYQKAIPGDIPTIDNGHAYGPEQIATLPIHPILGSGKQPLQPVFTGDVVEAGLNFREGTTIINAIGHEVLTQDGFIEYFCQLRGKKFTPVHVPLAVAEPFAKAFPMGHFAPFAIEGCRLQEQTPITHDASAFEELLGHETKTLNDVYGDLGGKPLHYPRPPLQAHLTQSIRTVLQQDTEVVQRLIETI